MPSPEQTIFSLDEGSNSFTLNGRDLDMVLAATVNVMDMSEFLKFFDLSSDISIDVSNAEISLPI